MREPYIYENEELIKRYTTQEYEQEGGEIITNCWCWDCGLSNKHNTMHVQLETGKFYCENRRNRRKFRGIYCTTTKNYFRRGRTIN